MIVRSLILRHGRFALPKSSLHAIRRRTLATVAERHNSIINPQNEEPEHPQYDLIQKLEIRDPSHPVAQDWMFFHHQKSITGDIGSALEPFYKPHELLTNPPAPEDVTLELLMASQSHLGHATSLWHPANAKYIFGIRGRHDPIHIISLDVTAAHLRRACKIVQGVTRRGGVVLFVGTREGQARAVTKAAKLAGGCHMFTRWTPGSISNGQQILEKCRKKVVNEHDEEVFGFQDQLAQTAVVKPDLVVCLNPLENYVLLRECGMHNIPTIGIIDTDANPTWVTYPIPANDDSLRCVQVIAGVLGRAGQAGREARLQATKRTGEVSPQAHGLNMPNPGQREKEMSELNAATDAEEQLFEELISGTPQISPSSHEMELQAQDEEAYDEQGQQNEGLDGDRSLYDDSFANEAFEPIEQSPTEAISIKAREEAKIYAEWEFRQKLNQPDVTDTQFFEDLTSDGPSEASEDQEPNEASSSDSYAAYEDALYGDEEPTEHPLSESQKSADQPADQPEDGEKPK